MAVMIVAGVAALAALGLAVVGLIATTGGER
jgi:hypothetical protein